jgi:hypothetical protein
MVRSRTPLSVSSGGASSSFRAWASPSAGVEPSLALPDGRLTPSTGLPAMALCYSLVVIDQIDIGGIALLEAEDDAPIGPHSHAPVPRELAAQRMEPEPR